MPWTMSAGMARPIYSQRGPLTLLICKFYTNFNIKLVFLLAITCFEVGSVICGSAPILTALIVGRAIAGLGASGIFFWCSHHRCSHRTTGEASSLQQCCNRNV